MKKELWFVLFGSVGILLAIISMLQVEPISISTKPADVKVRYFDPKNPPEQVGTEFNGVTRWNFVCPSQLNYEIVEEVSDPGGSFVRIKVTAIKVNLSLDITEWLPENPSRDLQEHESGHATICLRVYDQAKSEAHLGASQIIGKTYSGSSRDKDSACKAAGDIAIGQFTSYYEEAIARKAQNISEIYDGLNRKDYSHEKLLDRAFKLYEEGKPRLISLSADRPMSRQSAVAY